ncbi:MAG: AraC family transcriptional regulator [Clostridiales bacterium]|nr:AraC family transcriptional regulator [Clostridiales bacterium]
MRITPVCTYIASNLNCNVTLYSAEGTVVETHCTRVDFSDTLLENEEVAAFLFGSPADAFPAVYCINGETAYTRFAAEGGFYLIGPVNLLFSDKGAIFTHMLHIQADGKTWPHLMVVSVSTLLKDSLLLFNLFRESDLAYIDCLQMNYHTTPLKESLNRHTTDALFSNREHARTHNPYDQEFRMLNSIEAGSMAQLKASWSETYPGTLGVTSRNPIRNGKNMAQYVIFAASRAAIRGGLQPEEALTFVDACSQQIEDLEDMSLLEPMVSEVVFTLTQKVHEAKTASLVAAEGMGGGNPLVERCKNYVFAHLHEPLTVQEIAENLGANPNYLTARFRKQEGITLYQYILAQKIDLAKNLMTYSTYSFLEIANYLGFASQSHLGTQFKKFTGMTLKQFRDRYHKEEW